MIGSNFTAVVVARNERHRLPLVLENLKALKNVLVVDNFSTDETPQIAEHFGRPLVQVKNDGGFCENEEWMSAVYSHLATPYMLLCACAEYVPLSLLKKYSEVADKGFHHVVYARRLSVTAGLPIPIDLPPAWLPTGYKGEVRFFRVGAIDYRNNAVHSRGRIVCELDKVLHLPRNDDYIFVQYRDYDSSETEDKHRIYSDVAVRQISPPSGWINLARMGFKAVYVFGKVYFLFGGFRFGFLGFMNGYYRFHMELGLMFRAYELKNDLFKKDIQQLHIAIRRKTLAADKVESDSL